MTVQASEDQIAEALTALELIRSERDLDDDPFLYLTLPQPVLDLPITLFGDVRITLLLLRNDVFTLEDLLENSADELLDTRNFGGGMLGKVQSNLHALGLHLADHDIVPPKGDFWVDVPIWDRRHLKRLHSRLRRLSIAVLKFPPEPYAIAKDTYLVPWWQGIKTIGDLQGYTATELRALRWRSHGRARVNSIIRSLGYYGLGLKDAK